LLGSSLVDEGGIKTKFLSIFPANREIYRDLIDFADCRDWSPVNWPANSIICGRIPDAMKQGIFRTGTGN
jgi:hypothetical protein